MHPKAMLPMWLLPMVVMKLSAVRALILSVVKGPVFTLKMRQFSMVRSRTVATVPMCGLPGFLLFGTPGSPSLPPLDIGGVFRRMRP